MNKDEDIKLLLSAQNGNKRAFQALFDKYYQKAVGISYKITLNLETSEDIVMDSFLDMYNLEITKEITFNSYFLRVVVNNSLNELKKQKRIAGEYNDDIQVLTESDPEIITQRQEETNDILKKLNVLPDNQRLAFILVNYEGYSYNEVSEIMKITPKAVEGLLWRARKKVNLIFSDKINNGDKDEL